MAEPYAMPHYPVDLSPEPVEEDPFLAAMGQLPMPAPIDPMDDLAAGYPEPTDAEDPFLAAMQPQEPAALAPLPPPLDEPQLPQLQFGVDAGDYQLQPPEAVPVADLPELAPESRLDLGVAEIDPLAGPAYTNESRGDLLASQGAEAIMSERIRREDEMRAEESARKMKALADSEKAAADNLGLYQRAQERARLETDAIRAEAKALAQREVDPNRWWNTRSAGQQIAAVIAAVAGGLSTYRTGRNIGLEMINQAIDRDMESQRINLTRQDQALGQRRAAVREDLGMAAGQYQHEEAYRIAAFAKAEAMIDNQMAGFDPAGSTALRLGEMKLALRQQAAAAMEKAQADAIDRGIKVEKHELDIRKQLHDEQEARQRLAIERGKLNLDRQKRADALDAPPDEYERLRNAGLAEDVRKKRLENSPEERERTLGVGEIVNEKGKKILFRDPATANDVAMQKSAVDTAANLIDEMIFLRKEKGWSSDLVKSPEWRRLSSNYASVLLENKDIKKLGVLAGPDMELMAAELGTDDVTEVRDPLPGLEQFRKNMVIRFNNVIRGHDEGAARYEPPKLNKSKTADEVLRDAATDHVPGLGVDGIVKADKRLDALKDGVSKAEGYKNKAGVNASIEGDFILHNAKTKEAEELRAYQDEFGQLRERLAGTDPEFRDDADIQRYQLLNSLIQEKKKFIHRIEATQAGREE